MKLMNKINNIYLIFTHFNMIIFFDEYYYNSNNIKIYTK